MQSYNNNKPAIEQGWLRALLFTVVYFLLSVTAGFLLMFIKLSTAKTPEISKEQFSDPRLAYAAFAAIALISFILVWLFRKFIDRRTFISLGFEWKKNGQYAATGFFLGILLLCVGTLILFINKNLEWTDIIFNPLDLFSGLMLMAIISSYEELVFRGYILNNLMGSINKWPALLITSALFALAHTGNPYMTITGGITIFLAGVLLGINYIYTKNLWFGIFLHFGWNFFQGPVLGFDVSGLNIQSLLQNELHGSEWLTGGSFGFEGSALAAGLSLIAIVTLIAVYEKKFKPAITV